MTTSTSTGATKRPTAGRARRSLRSLSRPPLNGSIVGQTAMIVSLARIQGRSIRDWDSFHDEFHRVFGFPDFYGRNMNAWIDCMTSLDCQEDGMTSIHVSPGAVLGLEVADAAYLKGEHPEQYEALIECSAFVNWRRIEQGGRPVLALSFSL
jgi:barstar (barnase inhibitor)